MIKRVYFMHALAHKDSEDVSTSKLTRFTSWLPNPKEAYNHMLRIASTDLNVPERDVIVKSFTRVS